MDRKVIIPIIGRRQGEVINRSLATRSVPFHMWVGAIVFLMLGHTLGMRTAFLIGAGSVLAIAAAFAVEIREPARAEYIVIQIHMSCSPLFDDEY